MTARDEQLAHRLQLALLRTTLVVSLGVLGLALLVMTLDLSYHGDDFDGVGAVFAVLFAVPATVVAGACLLLLRLQRSHRTAARAGVALLGLLLAGLGIAYLPGSAWSIAPVLLGVTLVGSAVPSRAST